ncbi:DUF192 domain-containing protein [Muriicola sp. Z0-33]|uniref:DUF192 domain-containing protein n=1 Tax=Muriicola sp. Z0-33 TaxID=2816957 RepID=UPI002237680C|nr:DUF192 domain-containing protein [Muriicola sp. Z0-33]MCW5518026.1 DUF192 domain-containing protein [Muriicola sp. Z0-33]
MNIGNRSVLILLLGFIISFSACKETKKKVVTTTPVTFTKEGELSIYNGKTDSLTTKLSIEIANSDYETQTGLMYRESMDANQGMLFIFPEEAMRSFYMKNTKIPLDIIYIDREKRIVSIQKNAQPFDESGLPSTAPAQYVLEVNAGLTDQWDVKQGDRIEYSKN